MPERKTERLTDLFRTSLRSRERAFLCLPNSRETELGEALEKVTGELGISVDFWGQDLRWKALLKQVFAFRANVVVGPPLIICGLRKVARATKTPLFIRDVVLTEPTTPKMMDDLAHLLDCRIWELVPGEGKMDVLSRRLLPWSSVLDFRCAQTPFGMDLEVVTFPGEKLPELPSCAKLTLRSWDPETDIPFSLQK